MKQKLLAAILCICMVLTVVSPMAALAADYSDYVPGDVTGNIVSASNSINQYIQNNGNAGTIDRGEMLAPNKYYYDTLKMIGFREKTAKADGYWVVGPSWYKVENGQLTEKLQKDVTYVVAARLKNGEPEKKATLKAAFAYGTGKAAPVKWDVTSSEFQMYTGKFVPTIETNVAALGLDNSINRSDVTDATRGILMLDYSSSYTYIGKEYLYDIAISADKSFLEAGMSVNVTAKAVNQVGDEYTEAPTFSYKVVNADRTAEVSGFTITPSADTKSAKIDIGADVAPGTYYAIAEDSTLGISGFRKGVALEVKHVIRDTEPGEDPYYDVTLDVTDGETTMGIFDKITLGAALVQSNGQIGSNPQDFTWYVLDENRLEKLEDSFVITPSEDTTTAVIEPTGDVEDGTYYVVAETQDLRESVEIKIDTTNTTEDIISVLQEAEITDLTLAMPKILSAAELSGTVAGKADAAELASVIKSGVARENLVDMDSIKEYITRAAVVALYNIPNADVKLWNENGDFSYTTALKLEDMDSAGVTIYADAYGATTSEGKLALQEALSEKGFADHEAFAGAYAVEAILKAVAYPVEATPSAFYKILTADNLNAAGIDGTNYLALDNAVQFLKEKIIGVTFESAQELEEALAEAYESDKTVLNADYVPDSMPANIVTNAADLNDLMENNGTGAEFYRGPSNSWDALKQFGYKEKAAGKNTYWGAGNTYLTVGKGSLKTKIENGVTYAVSVRLKNGTPEKKDTIKAGLSYSTNKGAVVAWDVSSSEFQTYTGKFTATAEASNLSFGLNTTVDRSDVTDANRGILVLDFSGPSGSLYVGKEAPYDVSVESDMAKVEAGTSLTLTAGVVNQVGIEYTSIAPSFSYYAVNEDRSEDVAGFDFDISADTKTATVNVALDVEPGKYVLIAEDSAYDIDGFKKGIEIEVTKPVIRDTAVGTDPLYDIALSITDGDATMGVLDETTISAKLVDSTGSVGTNPQSFSWYILNADRTDVVTEGIVVTPSQDTTTAKVTLTPKVHEGDYYVIVEAEGLRKSVKITVDKTGDIATIIENIKDNTADEFEESAAVSVEIVELGETFVAKADVAEFAKVVIAGRNAENLTDMASLQDYFKRAALVALYNVPSDEVELFDEDGNQNYAAELKLSDIDKDGVTLYAASSAELSTAGKSAYKAALTGKGFANYEEFIDEAKEAMLLVTIANPKDDGTDYLDVIITEKNLAEFDIVANKYFALSEPVKFKTEKLMGKTFTLTSLASTLASAFEDTDDDDDEDEDEDDDDRRGSNRGGGSISFGGGSASSDDKDDNTGVAEPKEFADVTSAHWAYSDIHYLRTLGVIDGTTETTFEPEGTVTREQFLKLIIEAFKLGTAGAATSFADVDPNAWYAPYVNGGVALGIINGKSATEFGVGEALTREDACVMLDRALKLSGEISEELSFKDVLNIADYAKDAVAALAGYGIINGVGDNTFLPKDICSRAQAAKIISSALSVTNSLSIN